MNEVLPNTTTGHIGPHSADQAEHPPISKRIFFNSSCHLGIGPYNVIAKAQIGVTQEIF